MKTRKQAAVVIMAFLAAWPVFSQTNLQFTAVAVTDEQAIHLNWASQSNHVYQIQCANAPDTNANGSTTWQVLYDDYPSQGTNTFWLDTGNYNLVPTIPHPKNSPMRFYRILDKGPDGLVGDEPTISIISPSNGSVVSGLVTVTANASAVQGNLYPKLYVDGQVMRPSVDGSNYAINTCEWGNGPHVLFATVDSSTGVDGPINSFGLAGHGVSPFINVIFSNLITRISFSQEFFQPALGQIQQVSAVFSANADWTLNIGDAFSNVVKTATGSGNSMLYNWDGSNNSNQAVPAGVYYYYISAQTNGGSSDVVVDGSGGGDSPSSPALAGMSSASAAPTELWAAPSDGSGTAVPFLLYPPGFDTNDLLIFPVSKSEIQFQSSSFSSTHSLETDSANPDYSGSSSQSGPPAPMRPPTTPCSNPLGTIAVGYQMYNGNGTNTILADPISDGSGITGSDVQLFNPFGYRADQSLPWPPFHNVDLVAFHFVDEMRYGCWNLHGFHHDDDLHLSDLKGSGTFFNDSDIGLLIVHGGYGTSSDNTTGHPLFGIYFPIASGTKAQYLRMTDMNLGGASPTNGLKWMAIMACNSLFQKNWKSMINQNAFPYNSNLHMILGAATDLGCDPLIGQYWADYMLGDPSQQPPRAPMTIQDAWYNAAYFAYTVGVGHGVGNYPNPTTLAVVADPNCVNDKLQTNSIPSGGTWQYSSWTVYPAGNPPPTQ